MWDAAEQRTTDKTSPGNFMDLIAIEKSKRTFRFTDRIHFCSSNFFSLRISPSEPITACTVLIPLCSKSKSLISRSNSEVWPPRFDSGILVSTGA